MIDFVMLRENVELKQAIEILSDYLNTNKTNKAPPAEESAVVPQERRDNGGTGKKKTLTPERSNQLLEKVISFYEKTFADVPEGRKYLEYRGITDAGLYSSHRIGYCDGTLTKILPRNGTIHDELKELGILFENGNERFTGCVVVPVFNVEGNILTLYSRYTGNHSAKNHIFLPDRSKGIWNISAIKTYPKIILVESIIDGLSVKMGGYHNVIAISGNSSFKNGEVPLFKEHGVQQITFLLDGDKAGQDATHRLKERIDDHFSYEVKSLSDNHDPNSYLTEHGAAKLAELLASSSVSESTNNNNQIPNNTKIKKQSEIIPQAGLPSGADLKSKMDQPLTDGGFAVTYGLRRYEIHGLEKGARKLKATVRIEQAGKLHVDTLDFYSSRSRRTLCQDVARIFDQPAETIEADINKLLLSCEQHDPEKQKTSAGDPDPVSQMSAKEKKEAEVFGKDPYLIKTILADYEKCGLVGEKHNKLLCYLAAVSRKMDGPLSVLILSSSGAGKTALQDATLAFCPPEDVVKLTSLSGKALFYKDEHSLKHKILALEEGDGAEEASYAIRNLISAGVLIIEATIKDLLTGRMTTMENRVEGPTVVFLTTTNPNTDSETKSRFWVTSIDESRQQTRAILSFQRQRHGLAGLSGDTQVKTILTKHQNFQRLLKPVAVVNPFAEAIAYSDDRLQGRRDQPKYLNLIRTIAFLRQMQREIKTLNRNRQAVPYIEVELDDIRVANELTNEILGRSLDELSAPARELLVLLDELVDKRFLELQSTEGRENVPARTRITFTRREIRDYAGWNRTRVHTYLNELTQMEYVVHDSGKINCQQHYRLLYEEQGKDGTRFVPGLKSANDIKKELEKAQSGKGTEAQSGGDTRDKGERN